MKVSELNIAIAIRNLGIMLKSGLALEAALKVLAEQTEDKNLKKAFQQTLLDTQSGISVSESMSKHKNIFSSIVISIINVGEQGGVLEKNLVFLADYLKKNHELQKKIKNAMLYPMIVLTLTVAEMLGVIFFILPKLESLFAGFTGIPEYTVFILNASKFIRDNALWIVIGMVVAFILLRLFLGTLAGKIFKDKFMLSFPVIKELTKKNILATFSRTLSILLESGIPISKALEISAETMSNSQYQKVLKDVHEEVKSGQNLATGMAKYPKYFPITFVKMVEIGEQTGTLQENLVYSYEAFSEEVQDMANNLTTLLEPMLLIFIGLMIGFLALIIIGPIYQLTSSINA